MAKDVTIAVDSTDIKVSNRWDQREVVCYKKKRVFHIAVNVKTGDYY